MSIYGNAVKNPITTLMVFIAIIIFGLYSLVKLPIDFFPEIELPVISVFTSYPGTNAADIETNISRPLEDGLTTVSNLKQIYSQSRDNISLVMLEFEYGTDLDGAANDIRDALAFAKSALPDEASEPTIIKFSTSMMPILVYAITAKESYEGIEKLFEEKIVNHLNRIDGIGSIYLIGTPTREIGIDIDPIRLEAYNLTVEQIGSILQAENLNMPAGNVEMGKSDYPLRVQGEFEESDQIKNIVIGNFRGRTIYLKDVTTVSDTIKKMTVDQKIDGQQGIRMMVMKQSGANTVQIVKKINKELKKLKEHLEGLKDMDTLPGAIFMIDVKREENAVAEGNKLGIPVVAVVDTNCDPDGIDKIIPGNDDAIRAVRLMCKIAADTIIEEKVAMEKEKEIELKKKEDEERAANPEIAGDAEKTEAAAGDSTDYAQVFKEEAESKETEKEPAEAPTETEAPSEPSKAPESEPATETEAPETKTEN